LRFGVRLSSGALDEASVYKSGRRLPQSKTIWAFVQFRETITVRKCQRIFHAKGILADWQERR
jgi:hypothetical protein